MSSLASTRAYPAPLSVPLQSPYLPRLGGPPKGVEEPEGEEGQEADGHGVAVRVRGDVLEEVLELPYLHLVARQLLVWGVVEKGVIDRSIISRGACMCWCGGGGWDGVVDRFNAQGAVYVRREWGGRQSHPMGRPIDPRGTAVCVCACVCGEVTQRISSVRHTLKPQMYLDCDMKM